MGIEVVTRAPEPPAAVGWCAVLLLGGATTALFAARWFPAIQDAFPLRGRWLQALLASIAFFCGAVAVLTIRPLGDLVGGLLIAWPNTCILVALAMACVQIGRVFLTPLLAVTRALARSRAVRPKPVR